MCQVKTITFHHAHNFGSMLQTYALQEFVRNLGREYGKEINYEIIDFYTRFQEEFYAVLKKNNSIKNIVKNLMALPYLSKLTRRNEKFEQFLKEYCNLTRRYFDEKELQLEIPKADYYISGSDQLWNVRAQDFSDAYYLDFALKKKISYAASFGPLKIDWSLHNSEKYAKLLSDYTDISVRESGSADNVEKLIGRKCEVHVDPTLLLSVEQWRKIQSDASYNSGKYILLYCLEPSKMQLQMANAISKKLNLPIVVLRYNNKNDIINSFVKKYDAGPKDFLSYIDHAQLVLTSSFHGTLFSIIYSKPFFVFDGMNDNRISSILVKTGLCERAIKDIQEVDKVDFKPLNNQCICEFIQEERRRSREYLTKALHI